MAQPKAETTEGLTKYSKQTDPRIKATHRVQPNEKRRRRSGEHFSKAAPNKAGLREWRSG